MYDVALFPRTLRELAGRSFAPTTPYAVLDGAADRIASVLGAAGCVVAPGEAGRLGAGRLWPDAVGGLCAVEVEQQAGPCVDAFRTGEPVVASDLSQRAGRWPAYCSAAEGAGIGSVLAVPLLSGDQALGALGLHATPGRTWDEADLGAAGALAAVLGSRLAATDALRRHEEVAAQLQRALDSRTLIEQAKGMVAARQGVPVDAAFEQIRRHARAHNVTVRAVADGVVNLGLELGGQEPGSPGDPG